jgi:cytochrome P450
MSDVVFDPLDPLFVSDPHPVYRRMRDQEPAHRTQTAAKPAWVITRYQDVARLLKDPRAQSRPLENSDRNPVFDGGPAGVLWKSVMVLSDPPMHTRLRKLANKALTRRAVEVLRPRGELVVREALDAVEKQGEMDVVNDLAYLVPLRVICGMLGIPERDREELISYTEDFFRLFIPEANDAAGVEACHRACQSYIEYLTARIEERRQKPENDLLSALVAAEDEGDRLSRDELVAMVLTLLTGGFETTRQLISGAVHALIENPAQRAQLEQDPARMASAVDEFLRLESPVQAVYRHHPDPVEVGGRVIPPGELIWLILASANRDERQFPAPETLDVLRTPNDHVAFGGFRHYCIGAHLAQLEASVAIGRLIERFGELEFATRDLPRGTNFQFRALVRLPIRFRPR